MTPTDSRPAISTCPRGEVFPLPLPADYEREGERLRSLVAEQRRRGREVVVVMGLGFVGAIMAGVVADSVNKRTGRPGKFVIAMQRPSPRSYWKIHYLNRGLTPVQAEDPEVVPLIRRTVLEKRTLTATFTYEALELADVVVVDVQCDYVKDKLGDMRVGRADIAALEESFKIIGERIKPDCLVLVETTVPPGTCEKIAYPIVKQAFAARFGGANAECGMRNAEWQEPVGGTQKAVGSGEDRGQRSEVRGQQEPVGGTQKAVGSGEDGGQRSEVRGQKDIPQCESSADDADSGSSNSQFAIRNSQSLPPAHPQSAGAPSSADYADSGSPSEVTSHAETQSPQSRSSEMFYPQCLTRNASPAMSDPQSLVPDPLIAHSYERVMPGRNYVASVRDFWRVCSGVNAEARERVVRFLSDVLNVEEYPLTVVDRPIESETAKIVENSYRATILAFMDEWSRFAERHGVDITRVIQAIKVRPTHSNMMFPGPGIGGYCLPKDGALGQWGIRHLLGDEELSFPITTAAININDARGVHAAELVCDALAAMGRPVAGARVLICGCSYREDVGDTRYSGSELVARRLAELAAEIRVHDPYVDQWHELQHQDTYPAAGQSRARFFRNQEPLTRVTVENDLVAALAGVDAVVFAVRHSAYVNLDPEWLLRQIGNDVERSTSNVARQDESREAGGGRGEAAQSDVRPHAEPQSRGSEMSDPQCLIRNASSAMPHPQSDGPHSAFRIPHSDRSAIAVVDCFGILSNAKIARYLSLGCEVRCLGRGHVERIKQTLNGLPNGKG